MWTYPSGFGMWVRTLCLSNNNRNLFLLFHSFLWGSHCCLAHRGPVQKTPFLSSLFLLLGRLFRSSPVNNFYKYSWSGTDGAPTSTVSAFTVLLAREVGGAVQSKRIERWCKFNLKSSAVISLFDLYFFSLFFFRITV
jgi:hypothetical protein